MAETVLRGSTGVHSLQRFQPRQHRSSDGPAFQMLPLMRLNQICAGELLLCARQMESIAQECGCNWVTLNPLVPTAIAAQEWTRASPNQAATLASFGCSQ